MNLADDLGRYLRDYEGIWAAQGADGARQAHKVLRCLNVASQRLKTSRETTIELLAATLAGRDAALGPPVFLPNIGGCGSHWIASQLQQATGLSDAGEVYLPDAERERLASLDGISVAHAQGFVSGIAALHALIPNTSFPPHLLRTLGPLNTAHGVAHMTFHRKVFPDARFLHIDRDPRDRTLSVAYRKQEWRQTSAAGADDANYLLATARRGQSHYQRLTGIATEFGDQLASIRYEDFVETPAEAIRAACAVLGQPVESQLARTIGLLFAASGVQAGQAPGKSNLSSDRQGDGWRAHGCQDDFRVLHGVLLSTIEQTGYAPCDCLGRASRLTPSSVEALPATPDGIEGQVEAYSDGRRLRLRALGEADGAALSTLLREVSPDTVCLHRAVITRPQLEALCAASLDVLDLSQAVLDEDGPIDTDVRLGTVVTSGLAVRRPGQKSGRSSVETARSLTARADRAFHDFGVWGILPPAPRTKASTITAITRADVPPPPKATDALATLSAELTFGQGFYERPDDETIADALLEGRAAFRGRLVDVGAYEAPPEVPEALRQAWLFSYHSLGFLDVARRRYLQTGRGALRDRYLESIWSWLERHGTPPETVPTAKAPGDFAWYDMAVAWRTLSLIAALQIAKDRGFLLDAIRCHAEFLASDEAYAGTGNHALHQDDALLSAGLILGRDDLTGLAVRRVKALLAASIDAEGVVLEGSVAYHFFNAFWWRETAKRLDVAARHGVEGSIELPEMREFMAWTLAPDRKLALIGDTTMSNSPARRMLGDKFTKDYVAYLEDYPALNHALNGEGAGSPPETSARAFAEGYAISRYWQDGSAAGMATLRFGPGLAERVHAHDDAGAVTYYRGGVRVVEDGGLYGYYGGKAREFVKSARAHSTLTRQGARYYRSASPTLEEAARLPGEADLFRVACPNVEGIRWHRTLLHLRQLPGLVIQDVWQTVQVGGPVEQVFNLGDGFHVADLTPSRAVFTDGEHHGALLWLEAPERLAVRTGMPGYVAGWRSTFEGEIHPIATLIATLGGREASSGKATVVLSMSETLEAALGTRIEGFRYGASGTTLGVLDPTRKVAVSWNVSGEGGPTRIAVTASARAVPGARGRTDDAAG